jgi:hypothetical protein
MKAMPDKLIKIEIYVHKKRYVDRDTFLRSLEETVVFNLDGEIIEDILKQKYNIGICNYPQYKGGDILTYKKHISYKLDFETRLAFSVLLDRRGKFIAFSDTRGDLMPPHGKYETGKKLLNAESVRQLEARHFQKIIDGLDLKTIRDKFEDTYKFRLQGELDYQKGNIIRHNNRAVYQFAFGAQMSFSLLIDRMGNYMMVTVPNELAGIKSLLKNLHKNPKIHSPANLVKIGDRRHCRRFLARKNTLVYVRPRPLLPGKIVDISAGGLSFIYLGSRRMFGGSSRLSIAMAGLRKVISPEGLPYEVISDLQLPKKFPLNLLKIRKCSVQFGLLTNSQKTKLEYFINCHTAGMLT